MLRLLFPDQSIAEGHSAHEALSALCGGWNPCTVAGVKRALAKRAEVMTGHRVNPLLDDDAFVRRLDSLGFLALQEDTD